jgi:hypothetical protein
VRADSAAVLQEAVEDAEGSAAPAVALAEPGVWPPVALPLLASLVLDCTSRRRKKRPAGVPAVAARLRELRRAISEDALVECAGCLEALDRALCVGCRAGEGGGGGGGGAHWLCRSCLCAHVQYCAQPAQLAAHEGGIPCPSSDCAAPPHSIERLGKHLDPATVLGYAGALKHHFADVARLRKEAAAARARAAAAALAAATRAERVRLLRLVIAEAELTLHCPRCGAAFVDYDNCNALVCGQCAAGFCGLCLEDCGRDAHEHFYAAHGPDIHNRALFEGAHRERRRAGVVKRLRDLAGQPEAALLQRELLAALGKDLEGLRIDAAKVREEAGVR